MSCYELEGFGPLLCSLVAGECCSTEWLNEIQCTRIRSEWADNIFSTFFSLQASIALGIIKKGEPKSVTLRIHL